MSLETVSVWVGFNLFVLAMPALDLGVFHRDAHVVRAKEAAAWSAAWIALSLIFNVVVYFWRGQEITCSTNGRPDTSRCLTPTGSRHVRL